MSTRPIPAGIAETVGATADEVARAGALAEPEGGERPADDDAAARTADDEAMGGAGSDDEAAAGAAVDEAAVMSEDALSDDETARAEATADPDDEVASVVI